MGSDVGNEVANIAASLLGVPPKIERRDAEGKDRGGKRQVQWPCDSTSLAQRRRTRRASNRRFLPNLQVIRCRSRSMTSLGGWRISKSTLASPPAKAPRQPRRRRSGASATAKIKSRRLSSTCRQPRASCRLTQTLSSQGLASEEGPRRVQTWARRAGRVLGVTFRGCTVRLSDT